MATRSRSRKSKARSQSLSQFVVGTAAIGLPAPVRDVASTPWGSRLVLIGGALALASGVLTISWDGTVPSVKINHDRAKQVRQEIAAEVQQFQQQQLKSGKLGSFPGATGEPNAESTAQPTAEQPSSGTNSWRDYLPRQEAAPAANSGSSSSFSNSVRSALGSTDRTAPGPNSFQRTSPAPNSFQQQVQDTYQPQAPQQYQPSVPPQMQGAYQQAEGTYRSVQDAYQQVQDSYRQAKEQVESSPLFAPRTKVTR